MNTPALVVDVNRTKIIKILSAHSLYTSSLVCHPYFIWPELFIQFFTISLFKLLAPWKCIVHFWVVFINPNRIISIIFPKNTAHRWYEFTPGMYSKTVCLFIQTTHNFLLNVLWMQVRLIFFSGCSKYSKKFIGYRKIKLFVFGFIETWGGWKFCGWFISLQNATCFWFGV